MKECTHIGIRKARLKTRLASACAYFDYRPDLLIILRFVMVIFSPSRQMRCSTVRKTKSNLEHNSLFTIHYHPTSWRHAVWVTDCTIKQATNKQTNKQI